MASQYPGCEFTYTQERVARVKASISTDRFARYLLLAQSDEVRALHLYEQNTALSEALYGVLQGFEVTLRNSMHGAMAAATCLKDEGISINGLAQAIRVPANRTSLIVNGKRGITADTAARLGRYLGTSAQYWLNIQNRFDLDSLDKAAIERDVIPKKAG
jgi:addiction module HigA family antidote